VYIDVKRLRLRSGVSQRELARRMGIRAQMAHRWDKGSQPRAERLPKLVEALGLNSVDDLYAE
jgi:transcriptional regulator with XRE-family HTH domain